MDKETLSNYGWIVICVLVLAVMIALATPFGTFVADGFKATYTGLFQTGDNALDVGLSAVGVSNKLPCGHGRKEAGDHSQKECGHYNCQDTDCGCVPAACGVEGHWSNDGKDHTTVVNHTGHTYACQCSGWVVPEGGTYTTERVIDGKQVYNAGEQLPCNYVYAKKYQDTYQFGDYKYLYQYGNATYPDGWKVTVIDKSKSSYGEILSEINGQPVTNMQFTFMDCTNLVTPPAIPNSVTDIYSAFKNCTKMTTAPKLPDGILNLNEVFYNCQSLIVAPEIPDSVIYLSRSFYNCKALTTVVLPSTLTTIGDAAFSSCSSLEEIVIPSTVTEIGVSAFSWSGLKKVVIPANVECIGKQAFGSCWKLENVTFENTEGWVLKSSTNSTTSSQIDVTQEYIHIELRSNKAEFYWYRTIE